MAQDMKHSFNGHRKQSAGFNQAIWPPLSIPARSVRKERRCAGNDRNEKNKADTEHRSAKAEEVKICDICGEMIIGEYDYVRTKRRTELYLHKGMSCRKKVTHDQD